MTPANETNKDLVTNLKEKEIYKLPNKKFKITIWKKFSNMQNTGRRVN